MTIDIRHNVLPDRIEAKIMRVMDGCWLWTAATVPNGYGQVRWRGRNSPAHRVVYEILVGPLPHPAHLEADHLCRVVCCVNPDHIQFVTHKENVQRGNAGEVNRTRLLALTHCKRGHEFTEKNTYRGFNGTRECRACHCLHQREYLRRRKEQTT